MFVLSFKNGNDDPARNSFDEYYMPLAEIKDFNLLIDNKPIFYQPVKNKQETYEKPMKNLLKCQKIIICNRKSIRLFASSKLL